MNIRNAKTILCLFFIITFSLNALADTKHDKSIELLHEDTTFTFENAFMTILPDQKNAFTIQQIINPSLIWKQKGDVSTNFWVKINYINKAKPETHWLLEILSLNAKITTLYYPDEKGEYKHKTIGSTYNFDKRPNYKTINFVYDLPHELNKNYTCYLKVEGIRSSIFIYRIISSNELVNYTVNEYFFLGIYYGILCLAAVLAFTLFIGLKEKIFIYYCFYIIGCTLNSLSEDGLGFQYLWPSCPSLNSLLGELIAPVFFICSFIMYAGAFLEIKKSNKPYYIIFIGLIASVVLYYSIGYISFKEILISYFYIVPFTIVFIISILRLQEGFTPARYFIVGYSFVFFSLIIYQLRIMDIIEGSIISVYSFNIGISVEVLILAFALSDKMKIIKNEKETAQHLALQALERNNALQEKVNQELEFKVAERTKELHDAKIALENMANKLQEMNAHLDYDNWQLNKKVKEETKARIINQHVSEEEFFKIFPTDTNCLLYLEELKWKDGYTCKQCGNSKFNHLAKLRSRKCTRCNQIESAMANTLFQGVRFDLNKAFYIAYLVTSDQKVTVEEIAAKLSLSTNTAWKFRTKVNERLEVYKKVNKVKNNPQWEDLVVG